MRKKLSSLEGSMVVPILPIVVFIALMLTVMLNPTLKKEVLDALNRSEAILRPI